NPTDLQGNSDSELSSMPDDDLHSVSEFETVESDEDNAHEVTHSEHNSQDENAFAERLSLCEEVSSLHFRLEDMESSIVQQLSRLVYTPIYDEVNPSIPALVTSALKEHLPTLIFESLKECLPQIIKEAVQSYIPSVSEQFAAKQTELNKKMVKKMNKQFNIAHTTEIHRFVTLQKELSKVLQSEIDKSVESKVSSGMEEVRDDLQTQTKHLTKYCLSVQDMQSQLQEVQHLLESAIVIDDIAGGRRIRIHMQTLLPLKGVSFTDQLFETTSSEYSPIPPKEPTPPRDTSKGKDVATEEPKNKLVAYIEEGWSNLKMPKMTTFITPEGTLFQEDFTAQLREMKRLAELKEQEKKSDEELRRLLNLSKLRP
ncbi:hypothetical protein Tco_1224233, partial [Tanacetum coccineum]